MNASNNGKPRSPGSNSRRMLARGLVLAVTLHAFEQIAIVAILEDVVSDLDGRDFSGVIFGVYLLASILASVIAGTRIDRQGPLGAFVVGLACFAAGLAAAALAGSVEVFIAARAVQGAGGGLLLTVAYAAINIAYDESERPAILAQLSVAWVAPGLLGPLIAAGLASLPVLEWRWVFVALLPLTPLVALFAVPGMRAYTKADSEYADHETAASNDREDSRRILLALILCVGAALIQFGSVQSKALWQALSLLPGATLTVYALWRLMPPGTLWLRPILPAAIALKLASHFAFFGTDAFIPFALQEARGASIFLASLAIAPAALTWATASVLVARYNHGGKRYVFFVGGGFAALAVGIALALPVLQPEVPLALAFVAWGVAGFGVGFAYLSLNAIAMRETYEGETGGAGRTAVALNIADSLGFAFGTTASGAILLHASRAGFPSAEQFATAWTLHLIVALLCVLAARRLRPR